jgi:hypothetical protein
VLSHLLQRYRQAREARLKNATRSQRASAMLVVISLQKRLLSSIEAFARTLDVHSRTMRKQAKEQAGWCILAHSQLTPGSLAVRNRYGPHVGQDVGFSIR